MEKFDRVIIGAGIYGLYAARECGKRGEKIILLEKDQAAFKRATYINQARVHMGYHYPRSVATAEKSAHYFERFSDEFSFCIKNDFEQIYATSSTMSWTSREAFKKFCNNVGIPCQEINPDDYFNNGLCDGAFITKEYTYDAHILRDYFLNELMKYKNVEILYNQQIKGIEKLGNVWEVKTSKCSYQTEFILNNTYAGINEIQKLMGYEPFKIKYELCEIILCEINDALRDKGLTVMDGPFFSIMPFGKTGYHSLTSVSFTPHMTSYEKTATFDCQNKSNGLCTMDNLYNCNDCPCKPVSAWPYMSQLAKKYVNPKFKFNYKSSLYSMKPILKASEIDDSRPTMIKVESTNPAFVSILSGKINGIYDLDEVLGYV